MGISSVGRRSMGMEGVEVAPHLSARQAEILRLLMAGKANKDIAFELGIGVGTVKQHMVALFKKLNVTNRAMAISRGFSLGGGKVETASDAAATAMELRPAVILSLSVDTNELDESGRHEVWRAMQAACSNITFKLDAALVGRTDRLGVDVILGLYRVHEDNAARALRAARAIAATMAADFPALPVRAGMASGYLMASMFRRGGWTGETVVGRIIAMARELMEQAAPWSLQCDRASWNLALFSQRLGGRCTDPQAPLPVDLLDHRSPFLPPPTRGATRLVGRAAEWRQWRDWAHRLTAGSGGLVWVEGESGMGKTSLCRAFGSECAARGFTWLECGCNPPDTTCMEALATTLGIVSVNAENLPQAIRGALAKWAARRPVVLMIDDLHLGGAATVALMAELAALVRKAPVLVLGVARTIRHPTLSALPADGRLKLAHLCKADIRALITAEGSPRVADIEAMAALAAGVPLFAAELARHATVPRRDHGVGLPLTLVTLVLSRLDGLPLDRSLLAKVAHHQRITLADLRMEWAGDPADLDHALTTAVELGILTVDGGSDTVTFHHPLLTEVLRTVMLDEQLLALGRLASASPMAL